MAERQVGKKPNLRMTHGCMRRPSIDWRSARLLSVFPTGQMGTTIPDMPGTLAIFARYGVGNPRDFVSGRFTSLVNCSELVNSPYSLG